MYLHEENNSYIINLRKNNSSDLYDVLEILTLFNKNVCCATSIIFELCCREFQMKLECKQFEYTENLKQLTKYIEQLSGVGRFSKDKFRKMCHEIILKDEITLEILWWLDKNNLFYFEEYWATKSTSHIILQLKTLISSFGGNLLTAAEQEQRLSVVHNIFLKLLLGVNSHTSSVLCIRSQNIFDKYLDDALDELVFNADNAKLIGFVQVFNDADCCYGSLMKGTCRNILRRLISCQEKVTIYNAIEKQEQWSTSHLAHKTIDLYFDLSKRFTLEELFELIQEVPEQKLNWRLMLTFVAVIISKMQESYKQLKSMISRHLQNVFSDPSTQGMLIHTEASSDVQVLAGVVVARTACLEQSDPGHEYSEWVADTWGANSVQRCGTSPGAWTRLLGALITAVPHEPTWTLTVHVARALRAPPKHNHDMLAYKELCRSRIQVQDTTTNTNNEDNNSDSEDFCT